MIQFVLTVVQDEGEDEAMVDWVERVIGDAFDEFIDGVMQDYPDTNYSSGVDWSYNCLDDEEE